MRKSAGGRPRSLVLPGRCWCVSPGAVEIAAGDLAKVPRAVARRLIRHAIRQAKGNLHGVQFSHIEDVLELPEAGGKAELPGIHAIRSFDWLRLEVPGRPTASPERRRDGSRAAAWLPTAIP